jgi:hypothetical protein
MEKFTIFNDMERIKSKSKKRLIIEGQVNGKDACFLLDTGASAGIMDDSQSKKYGLVEGRPFGSTIVGAGGEIKDVHYCMTMLECYGKTIPQFLLADIRDIVRSIKRETGIEVLGIISLPQMRIAGLGIDANDNEIIIE